MAPEEGLQDVVSYPKIACEVQTHFLCQCSEETALKHSFPQFVLSLYREYNFCLCAYVLLPRCYGNTSVYVS
jgi:hypothetical protein